MKPLFLILFLCIALMLPLGLSAQNDPPSTWERQFHFSFFTDGSAVAETSNGDILTVCTLDDSNGRGSMWLLRLTSEGHFISRKLLAENTGYPTSFMEREPGKYLTVSPGLGHDISGAPHQLFAVTEFDGEGNILYSHIYDPGKEHYSAVNAAATGDGGYVQTGTYDQEIPTVGTRASTIIQKFSASHQIEWSDTINISDNTIPTSLIMTRDQKIIVAGLVLKTIHQKSMFLMSLDNNGKPENLVKNLKMSGDSNNQPDQLIQLKNGNLVMLTTDGGLIPYIVSADSTGNILDTQRIRTFNQVNAIGNDGNYIYLLGNTGEPTGALQLEKRNGIHDKILTRQYDDTISYGNYGARILPSKDGGLFLLGTRYFDDWHPHLYFPSDMVLIKTDKDGNLLKTDYTEIKQTINNLVCRIYPNPAHNVLSINIPENALSKDNYLFLCNARGMQVARYFIGENRSVFNIDISAMPAGLYLYKINNKDGLYSSGRLIKE